MWYVYAIESLKNNYIYIGKTSDLRRRFQEHNTGIGGDYTDKNRPYKLIFYEAFLDKNDAGQAELFWKSGCGREILKKDKLTNYFKNKHSGIV